MTSVVQCPGFLFVQLYILKIKFLGYMAKLIPMVREFNTSPVAELDVLSHNISVIASELGVEYATPVSTVSFVRAIGDGNEFKVTVDAVYAESKAGVATILVDRDSDVEYTISADGFEDITGTLYVSDVNAQVLLPRFVDASLDGKFTVMVSATPSDATVKINGQSVSELEVAAGSNVSWSVSKDGYIPQSGNIQSISKDETVTVTLEADAIESYSDVAVVLSYAGTPVAASGGTVTPTVSYSQIASYKSGKTETITSGGSVSFSGDAVDTTSGSVDVPSAGTTVSGVTLITTATCTVSLNGKSGSASAEINRAANTVEYSAPVVSGGTYAEIPAGGGSSTPSGLSYTQTATYSSGSSEAITTGGDVTYSMPTVAGLTLASASTGEVSGADRGSVVGDAISGTVTATVSLNSKSGSLEMSVSQAANEATYGDVSVVVGAIADIPASGGEAVVGDVTCTQAVSYTSGASSENSIEDYTVSSPLPSASDLSTTVKERTKVGTVTVTATGQGDKSGTGSADVYQAANVATYGDATVSLTYPDIPAEGGSVNPNALTGTQSVSYTSGASESDVFEVGGSPVYSGMNVDPSTGTVTAEATESASRTLITTASVSVQSHGKTATASAEVYQAAKTE